MGDPLRCPHRGRGSIHRLRVPVQLTALAEITFINGAWEPFGLVHADNLDTIRPEFSDRLEPTTPVMCRCGWIGTFGDLVEAGDG